MRLFGILGSRPEYKDPSWEVRLRAVEGLDDQKTLKKIAQSDEDERVAIASVNKLSDEPDAFEVFIRVENLAVKTAAMKRLSSPDFLSKVAIRCPYEPFGRIAIESLHERFNEFNGIADLATDPVCRVAAVMKIADQKRLKGLAQFSKNRDVQLAAIAKLTDGSEILKIAVDAVDPKIKEAALGRLDQEVILEIVLKTESAHEAFQSALNARRAPSSSLLDAFNLYTYAFKKLDPDIRREFMESSLRIVAGLSKEERERELRRFARHRPATATKAPAKGTVTTKEGREVTFVIPCAICGYMTTVGVTLDWTGNILSGSDKDHDFQCQGCGKVFTVSKEMLKQYTNAFV